MTVIREELVERAPHIVSSLCDAYARAKAAAQPTASAAGGIEPGQIVGHDPWQFGKPPIAGRWRCSWLRREIRAWWPGKFSVEELFVPNMPPAFA
jgi:hypothetical protein